MKSKVTPFSVAKAEDSSGFLLWQVTTLWQREIRKALEKHDITHSQFVLLASILWLSNQKLDVTQIVLSNHSKIDPMTTSQVLRTLQKKGLIERAEHATDTRAKNVALTSLGQKTAIAAVKSVEKFDTDFFEILGAKTSAFNKSLVTLLSRP